MRNSLSVGVAWSTTFPRPGWRGKFVRKLRYAYRAPSFVTEGMVTAGHDLRFLKFDEACSRDLFDPVGAALASSVDFFYISTHGRISGRQYTCLLHAEDWPLDGSCLGQAGPSVATFDTCDLIDLADVGWRQSWESAGPALRLLLGFASPATVAENSTRRGQAFMEMILAGEPVGTSWLRAVHSTAYAGLDLAVAIGFGSDSDDASWAVRGLGLKDVPQPRHSIGLPTIEVEVCH